MRAFRIVHLHPFFPEMARWPAAPSAPKTKPAKKNAAKHQQTERLSVRQRLDGHYRRQDGVPKHLDNGRQEECHRRTDQYQYPP